jgi:symplekin
MSIHSRNDTSLPIPPFHFTLSLVLTAQVDMSLYADEDLAVVQDTGAGPSTSSSTAPLDPVTALSNALTCTPESVAQAEAFLAAGQRFEENPEKLPDLCNQLLPMIVDGGESLLRAWTLDMVALTVGRSGLNVSIKEDGESFVKRW